MESFFKSIENERSSVASSIMDFKFNKKRIRILSACQMVNSDGNGILYWMSRDQRVQDNWALLFAQKLALKNQVPLYVVFSIVPKFLDATIRHYDFLIKGLKEVAEDCKELNIDFHVLEGTPKETIPNFVKRNKIGGVVIDFSPLRILRQWIEEVKSLLPNDIPVTQVDAHNIIPCWIASDKVEYGARTIRPKINRLLSEFFSEFPPVIKHPYSPKLKAKVVNWMSVYKNLEVDDSVKPVEWATPGTMSGLKMLDQFCKERLAIYAKLRNDPNAEAVSDLSPWLHFGQISAQRCVLEVSKYKTKYRESVNAFTEELVIRRELSDNFCFYNDCYDKVMNLSKWAEETIKTHRNDKRPYVYTRDELENYRTHDDLWNSAQIQLVKEGKMHGFMRMYWGKKILEWTKSIEEALEIAIYLNDKYSLDGRDPNGYVGCAWSICGVHDNAWTERPIYGKIRFMNYAGCKRKFKIDEYISKWGGIQHNSADNLVNLFPNSRKKRRRI